MTHVPPHSHHHGFGHIHHHGHRGCIIEGLAFQFARAIMAEFFRPLNTGPFGHPCMPNFWNVRCGPPVCHLPKPGWCDMPKPAASWTAQVTGTNTANVDLGDGQKLEIDERSSQITIINEKTGERTRIWGDPHVEIDGKQAYDFWGTTTFTLENGTKITINTEQWNGNPNAYVASQVVVTKGNNAVIIDGVSQNKLGDLQVSMSNNGRMIDATTRDGYTLHENATGSGWRTEAGNVATQDDLMATAVGREYGPGSQLPSLGEFGNFIGAFLLLGILTGGFTNERQTEEPVTRGPRVQPTPIDTVHTHVDTDRTTIAPQVQTAPVETGHTHLDTDRTTIEPREPREPRINPRDFIHFHTQLV